ncbi:MAG: PDZ domain-containing protein [Acidobacteriota bacterium]|jgi:tricorn protease
MSRHAGGLAPVALTLWTLAAVPAGAVDTADTRMLADPALSREHVAFVYAEDLWIARRDGTGVRRLTSHVGVETAPRFSPDGRTIAFSGQYDGNVDVYSIPVEGGAPTRLTWHPGADRVQGFTADGAAVLFTSRRTVHTRRHRHLYSVPLDGGFPSRLPVPTAHVAELSPDGSRLAYVPDGDESTTWKHYRGGTASRIWILDLSDLSVEEIPRPPERANDTDPVWIGERIWFRSDRTGEFNLFSYDPAGGAIEQHTFHEDFPILALDGDGERIVYEQAGFLHLFDPRTGSAERLVVGVATDLIEARPRYEKASELVRDADLSPSGVRAVFETRGEIVTLPADKGEPRNLTSTPGVHERSPAWSPDGRWIAYFSDASGEYRLVIAPHDGREETGSARTVSLDGAGFYRDPKWSPDGAWISYVDNSLSLYVLEVATGAIRKVSSETLYGPVPTLHHAWSPDSRWLAYTRNTKTYFQRLCLYSVEEDRSHTVTEGLSDVGEPVFDAGGEYLWFSASTDAGPVRQWFAVSGNDVRSTNTLYAAVLQRGVASPVAPENQEETPDGAEDGDDDPDGEGDGDQPPRVEIDLDGLAQRIVALPVEPALYRGLRPGAAGTLFYLKARAQGAFGQPAGASALTSFSTETLEEKTLAEDVRSFTLSADRKKLLYATGDRWAVVDAGSEIEAGSGVLPLDRVELRVDPRAEWEQMYHEAWRIQRDYFYDPGMHGADWPALRDKYAVFLPHLATRSDLNRVLRWLGSELTVGHLYVGGGDSRSEPEQIPGGLLGADYQIVDGRYRFARVYGGLNWNPDLRAPLTEPGVDVREGELLLAVDGRELTADENLFARFENRAGEIVEITVGPSPDGDGARTVEVVPIEDEISLRNRAWVEDNLARVDEATGGRVAYVYVPNTAGRGHTYFKRYFYPQADRDAIIIDERYNGGGQVADYYIDILRRPLIARWAMRYGEDLKTPLASIQGPKVMIIDQYAGSGGDLLPWMFRKLDLGVLVGKRTWGGLVGILGFPPLLDGGRVSAPNLAIWTEDGWVVENEGVPPDVEVEQLPSEVMSGRDPQLEKAIELVLEQLEATPPEEPRRPEYPERAGG